MNELAAILERWRDAGPGAEGAILATVVHVKGSAYRRPGARMLVLGDGTRIGTISGGCLETDVVRRAWWWTDEGAAVRVFDNTHEDAARDFGLGCNGVITVLLERVETPSALRLLAFLDRHQARREACVIATVVRTSGAALTVGDRMLYDSGGLVQGRTLPVAGDLAAAVCRTFTEKWSRLVHLDEGDVFVEWVGPPQRLFVFGSGHDVVPLATIAGMMGWTLTVADRRSPQLDASRFPTAERVFAIPSSGDLSALGIAREDAVVVMTHNFAQDAALLPRLLAARPRYLGLLGPKSRAEKLFAEIGESGVGDNVHAPIGLAIGGEHPASIALAIAAEIQAVLHDQAGGLLREHSGSIHAPALEQGPEAATGGTFPTTDPGQRAVLTACGIHDA